jgi:DNA end-binding protein Ku
VSSRPVLKGFIRFNLVTIPVGVYTATQGANGVAVNQLHRDCGQRVRYKKCCPLHGELEQKDIVSGFQFAEDQYVVIDDKEKRAVQPDNEKAISIAGFVRCDAIDSAYFTDRHYYLLPDGDVGRKPYALLRQAMVDAKRHALAQVVMSSREHVAVLRPVGTTLMLSLLSYHDELKDPREFTDSAPRVVLTTEETRMARLLTEAMAIEDPDLSKYRDGYADRLREVIEAKVAGKRIVESSPVPQSARVINLMDALERSLKQAKGEKVKRRKAS